MRPWLLVIVLALLALPLPLTEAAKRPWAPAAVLATTTPNVAFITWAPGESLADYYNVYGIEGSSLVFVTAALDHVFQIDTARPFQSYAVSGVKGGIESDPVLASFAPCLRVDVDPPDAYVANCGTVAPFGIGTP